MSFCSPRHYPYGQSTLTRLFGWTRVAGHKAIVRLFGRFDMLRHERVQASVYRWFFDTVSTLCSITLDMDSTVVTRHGQQQGAARGYNPNKRGRLSHHPLLAFVAEARLVANFWLRPGDAHSANNVLQFIESTLHHLGSKTVGLLRADSGFYDQAVLKLLEGRRIDYIISSRLTQGLQQAIVRDGRWFALETGLELAETTYQAHGWVKRGASCWYGSRSNARRHRVKPCHCSLMTRTYKDGVMARW